MGLTVNGVAVTEEKIAEEMARLRGGYEAYVRQNGGEPGEAELREWAEEDLIEAELFRQEAAAKYSGPSDERAQQHIKESPEVYDKIPEGERLAHGKEALRARALMKEIRKGVRDLNALKAFLRTGMGACGGKTCNELITALFNVFPLPRLRDFQPSFAHAGKALDRRFNVLVFPEGTRSAEGELARFRPGIGLLARQCGAAVLPIALRGLGELKSGRSRWFRSGLIEVCVGQPLRFTSADTEASITTRLQAEVERLLND